jgi:hypothetical protein
MVGVEPVRSAWNQVAQRDLFAERCALDESAAADGEGKTEPGEEPAAAGE